MTGFPSNAQTYALRMFSGVTWLFVLAHFSHHVITALVVPLLPFIRNDFGLDYTQAGFVISAFTLSYGIAQMPAGRLIEPSKSPTPPKNIRSSPSALNICTFWNAASTT